MTHKIAISAGHYPSSPGACHRGKCEHEEASVWINNLYREMSDEGYDVLVVPTGGLSSKVRAINEFEADIAMEIHFNACGDCGASGCETLYYPGSSRGQLLAESIQYPLSAALKNRDRGVKEGWYKMDRPGETDFPGDEDGDEVVDYFLRATKCPAIILEPEFIEEIAYKDRFELMEMLNLGVEAIMQGVEDYFRG